MKSDVRRAPQPLFLISRRRGGGLASRSSSAHLTVEVASDRFSDYSNDNMKSSILAVSLFAVTFSTVARAFSFWPRCVKVTRSGPISPIFYQPQVSLASQQRRMRRTVLKLTDEDDTGESSAMAVSKIEGRKKRVILGYKAMALAYAAVALNSAVRGGVTTNFLHMFA
ncbi:hypothetical protein THAOC_03163, partial [Thalassiosira oceanica]